MAAAATTREDKRASKTQSASESKSDPKPGSSVKVTINRQVTRAGALKTLERLFMSDKSVAQPLDQRSSNFIELPKRRGGCIWTKRPNKIHPDLTKGQSATIRVTPQHLRDLKSVSEYVDVQ
ncbi:MAG: hypothetical protein JO353_03980 [Phycisphaerae bacterium]|nr:hypothetical protein [Phycisphaerae bacterium]